MNLKEQTYICTLARWGTISRAAEELHLTAPALSMFLSTLEKNLDVRLFRRTGKTLEPTAIGREYIRIAEKMLLLKEGQAPCPHWHPAAPGHYCHSPAHVPAEADSAGA